MKLRKKHPEYSLSKIGSMIKPVPVSKQRVHEIVVQEREKAGENSKKRRKY